MGRKFLQVYPYQRRFLGGPFHSRTGYLHFGRYGRIILDTRMRVLPMKDILQVFRFSLASSRKHNESILFSEMM